MSGPLLVEAGAIQLAISALLACHTLDVYTPIPLNKIQERGSQAFSAETVFP